MRNVETSSTPREDSASTKARCTAKKKSRKITQKIQIQQKTIIQAEKR